MLDERERLLVLGLGVEQLVDAADRLHHARELAFAHLLFLKVNKLHLNAALLKEALCFLGIEGLPSPEDLNIHGPAALTNKVGAGAIGFGGFDAGGLSCLDATQEPGHVFADVSHGGQTLGVLGGLARHGTKDVVPIGGGDHGHLVDGEVFIEYIEGGRRAAAAGNGDSGAWLVRKGLAASIEGAVEGREDASAGMRIVNGGAKDKAICLLGGSDQLVHHVVVKGAAAIELAALATANAVANGLGAQLEHLGIDALGMQLLGDLGERAGGVAVCLGAAIDQKNLHHKLHLLSVNSAENYLTSGQMAWGAIPATAHHTPRLDR